MNTFGALRSFIASADRNTRPPLEIHPWWGRRQHVVMRGMLVSALASPVADFTTLAVGPAAFPGTIVLDPFAGSGTAVIEAIRLGCQPVGIDLNPVAWWIMRNRLLRVDLAALDAAAQGIHDELAARTVPLYRTRCPACASDAPAATCFWAWSYVCPSCQGTTLGLPSTRVLTRHRRSLTLCPACGAGTPDGSASCPACGVPVLLGQSTVSRGSLTCVHCKSRHDLPAARCGRRRLVAIDADCPVCGPRLKPATLEDHERAADAENWLSGGRGGISLPRLDAHPLPDRLSRQGHRTFEDLFLARQRVSLGMLLAAIQGVADEAVQDTLLTLFSDLLDYHMTMTTIDSHGRLARGYRRPALTLQAVTAEANPWSPAGPGGWLSRYQSHCRPAKEQLLSDPEVRVAGCGNGWPPVRFAASAHDLAPDGVLLHCGSASDMPLSSGSVDLAVTSPPFFDALYYADLADLRYVWLRHAAVGRHPEFFATVLTPKVEEIVVQPARGSSGEQQLELYMENLEGAFREIARVLKPDGSLVYVFELPTLTTFTHALQWTLGAGFYIADICAVEFGGPAVRQSVVTRSFTIAGIFYCYKRGGTRPVRWKAFQDDFCFHVAALLRARPTATREQTIDLLWGEFVKQFSRAYPHMIADDGTAVSVAEAVDWVHALSSVTPAAGTSLAALAEAQALRRHLGERALSDADFATTTDAIARKLAQEVSPDQAAILREWFRHEYGDGLWDKLEPETREFLVGAEFLYRQCAGQDIDFGAVAVSFTKPLECELRKKFAPRLAAYAATKNIGVPPKAGNQKLDWKKLADGNVTLGNIEQLLSALELPENAPVAEYLGSRAAATGMYARERLPEVIKRFRENGRNAGAHIEPVEASVVEEFRNVLLAAEEHLAHWVEL